MCKREEKEDPAIDNIIIKATLNGQPRGYVGATRRC